MSIQIISVVRYDPGYLHKALQFLSQTKDLYTFDKILDAEFSMDEIKLALDKSAAKEVTRGTIMVGGDAHSIIPDAT